MGENYYWLRLMVNFFEEGHVRLILGLPNGPELIVILLKMKLKSLENEGYIIMPGDEKVTPENVASILNVKVESAKDAIERFKRMELIEIDSDKKYIFIKAVEGLIGSETQAADRMRKMRNKRKMDAITKINKARAVPRSSGDNAENDERNNVRKSYVEIEIEIEDNDSVTKANNVTHNDHKETGSKEILSQVDEIVKSESRSDAMKLSSLLYDSIMKKVKPPTFKNKSRSSTVNKWFKDIEKLLRIDGAEPKDVSAVIEWVVEDEFWSGNILSGEKLRKHYDKLFMQMKRKKKAPAGRAKYDEMEDV